MIPSLCFPVDTSKKVYQRGLVIDSQHALAKELINASVSKGIGD